MVAEKATCRQRGWDPYIVVEAAGNLFVAAGAGHLSAAAAAAVEVVGQQAFVEEAAAFVMAEFGAAALVAVGAASGFHNTPLALHVAHR